MTWDDDSEPSLLLEHRGTRLLHVRRRPQCVHPECAEWPDIGDACWREQVRTQKPRIEFGRLVDYVDCVRPIACCGIGGPKSTSEPLREVSRFAASMHVRGWLNQLKKHKRPTYLRPALCVTCRHHETVRWWIEGDRELAFQMAAEEFARRHDPVELAARIRRVP